MGRIKKPLLALLCIVIGVTAALTVWDRSPGPAWVAEQTVRRWLGRNAPEYTTVEVVEVHVSRAFPPPFGVKYREYCALGLLEEDNYSQAIRFELDWGPFPLKVAEAAERKDGKRVVLVP